jgi:hypothetical protein
MTASSRKVLLSSFSRANERLLPSVQVEGEELVSIGKEGGGDQRGRTDDESKLLKIAGVSRVFDRFESLG